YLPELIDLVWNRKINPGRVFDLTLPLDQWRRATARWTSAAPSRRCCAHERRTHDERMVEGRTARGRQGRRSEHLTVPRGRADVRHADLDLVRRRRRRPLRPRLQRAELSLV